MGHLGVEAQLHQAVLRVELSQAAGPGPHGADVQAEGLLVGGRGQGEGVVLVGAQHQAGDADPLARAVHKALGPLELQVGDTCGWHHRGREGMEVL